MLRISVGDNINRKKMSRPRSLTQTSFAVLMLLLSSGLVLLAGCGVGAINTSSAPITPQGAVLHGNVHGGNQPVSGSLIEVWAAGIGGYNTGSASLMKAGTTVRTSNDGSGSFTITGDYTCPSDYDAQVYITAKGGNPGITPPQGGTIDNSSLVLMAALGSCNELHDNSSTIFININEVSTVAAAYSLAQFATPNVDGHGISVSTSGGNTTGLANAMKTVNNLVDLGSGSALAITPFYKAQGSTPGGLLNSSYVPQARINTLADILAICVNSDGLNDSQCPALFAAATAPGGAVPTDTLQSILSIAQHPGNKAEAIFGLLPGTGNPFQPVLSSPAPVDWTLALTYTGGGLGVTPGTDPLFGTGINQIALDAQGNIWVAGTCYDTNFNGSSAIVEFDNQGNALSPALTASGTMCAGGYQPQFNGTPVQLYSALSVAIDLSENVWIGGYGGISKLASDGSAQQASFPNNCPGGDGGPPITRLAVDPSSGNFWVGCSNQSGSTAMAGVSSTDGSLLGEGGSAGYDIGDIAMDVAGNVWAVGATGAFTGAGYNLIKSNYIDGLGTGQQDDSYVDNKTIGGFAFIGSVVPDGLGNVFSPSGAPGTISKLESDGATVDTLHYASPNGAFGVQQLALDGNGILWGVSYSGDAATYGPALIPSYLVAMDSSGNSLSPTGTTSLGATIYGYTGTGGGGEAQPILANFEYNNAPNAALVLTAGIAIDGSGNVWVANSGVANSFFGASPVPPGQQIVEFIGMAAPVRTPLAQAVYNGEVGIRPQVAHAPAKAVRAVSLHK